MATKRSARTPHSATVRVTKWRRLIAVCLLRSISEKGATNAAAIRWLGITESTFYTWIRGERPISVEKILACPQLHDGFRQALCTFDHKHEEPLAYVARKGTR